MWEWNIRVLDIQIQDGAEDDGVPICLAGL
jgi:hypothetical protein